jgi:O-antigen/teichoic acid export membrane protein
MSTKVVARNTFWLALDSGVGFVSALICSVAVARTMGPEPLGYYNYALWLANITGLVATFGVPIATRKFAAEYLGKGDVSTAKAVIKATYRFQFFSAIIAVAVGLLVVFQKVTPDHRTYSALAILSVLPSMLLGIPTAALAALEELGDTVRSSIAGTVVNLTGVVLSLVVGWGLVGLTASLLVSRLADLAVRSWFYRRRFAEFAATPATDVPEDVRRRLVRFCWQSTLLLALDTVVWDRSEMLFLQWFCDIREVAFYSLCFSIMQQAVLAPRVLASASIPTLMVRQGRDPSTVGNLTATSLRYIALMALPLTLGMAALSGPAIRLIYGSAYVPAIPVLAVVAIFALPKALINPARSLLITTENQGFLVKWGIASAILNLSLDLWWIPSSGAVGAAYANGVSQLVATIGIWIFALRTFTIPVRVKALLGMAASAALMAAAAYWIARVLPALPAALAGVPVGAILYLLFLRLTRSLDETDRTRLMTLQPPWPAWFRNWYAVGLQRLTS